VPFRPAPLALLVALVACGGAPSSTAAATPPPAAPPPGPTAPKPASAVRNVDVNTLAADRTAGKVPLLVDVRTPEEFASGHVPGARNIPVDELGGHLAELESYKSGDVYLICQSGGRSARAAEQLSGAGYHAVNVQGGTGAWKAAGLPTE
jgi:rhodanese-related sulfurtransferase